ncbi:hypothetical protein E4U41_005086 [Claviceps citrina]|nr:hypothetical protein E4U41_005086 [Claviceps citrina]
MQICIVLHDSGAVRDMKAGGKTLRAVHNRRAQEKKKERSGVQMGSRNTPKSIYMAHEIGERFWNTIDMYTGSEECLGRVVQAIRQALRRLSRHKSPKLSGDNLRKIKEIYMEWIFLTLPQLVIVVQ